MSEKIRIEKNKFYLYKRDLVRVLKLNGKFNSLTLFNHTTQKSETVELDTAHFYIQEVYRIGEVAKMLQRSVETIRKYEQRGLIEPAKKFNITDKHSIRIYTKSEVLELADWFAQRSPVGRPGQKKWSKINRIELNKALKI